MNPFANHRITVKLSALKAGVFLSYLLVALSSSSAFAAPDLVIKAEKAGAVYQAGETITWRVELRGGGADIKEASYVIKKAGASVHHQGTVTLSGGAGTVQTKLDQPGTLLLEVVAKVPGAKEIRALGGAAIAPEKIPPSSPCPEDFDAFWKGKLDELAKVPANPVLEQGKSGKDGVDYWKITMDNIRGTHIRGQLARPAQGAKLPAMLVVQWAGVYGLNQGFATGPAAEGWLTLNITAHDLPIDEPESFYKQQNDGPLKNYTAIGNDDREKSYFLRMFLACYRAVEYLAQRPDWDGKTLIVTGTSQGGLQTFVTAGLNHKVTALLALVPAGCDNTGGLADRKPGWPYWMANVAGKDEKKALNTSRYFDGVNFAARIKCPALVGLGLIDTTSPPSGVYAAFNLMQGPKETVVLPDSDHRGKNNTQAPYSARASVWRKALLAGSPPPVK
ncbi:MAG: acetylxylan esterase [Verrucomicrobiota bacterium]